jgi:sec-independent protein translocase protein TatA
MGMSIGHLVVILLIILILFGAGRLPQVMSDLGKGIRAFRDSIKSDELKKKDQDSE